MFDGPQHTAPLSRQTMAFNLNSNYACNAEMLKYLRENRELTQQELAEVAGYTDRLIRKAESGAPIAARTIVDIAGALSTAEQTIHPEDLVSDPKAIARIYMRAIHTHQAETMSVMREHFDEEITFVVHGDPQEIPFAGTHRGIEAVDQMFRTFFEHIEAPPGHDPDSDYQYVSEGTNVVVWGNSYLHPKGRPLDRPMPLSHLMKFRRGKMYHFENQYDTRYAADLLNEQNESHEAE